MGCQKDDSSEKLKTIRNTVNQMLEQAFHDSQIHDDGDYFMQFVKMMNLISAAVLENDYKKELKRRLESAKRHGERSAKQMRKELEANTNRQIDKYLDLIRDIERIFDIDGEIKDIDRQYNQSMNELKGRKDAAVKDVEDRMRAELSQCIRHGENGEIWDAAGSKKNNVALHDISVKSNKCIRLSEGSTPAKNGKSDTAFKNIVEEVDSDNDLLYENAGNARYTENARASEYSKDTPNAKNAGDAGNAGNAGNAEDAGNAGKSEEEISQTEDTKAANRFAESMKNLTPDQKIAIRIMGEDGCSKWNDIAKNAMDNYKEIVKTEATLRSHFMQLINKGFVEKTKISTAGSANLGLYRLTDQGKESFKYLYAQDAVEPEMDRIISDYTTLEHGYGIIYTAALIKKMPFIQKNHADVIYDTRCIKYAKKISDRKIYVPDIVIICKNADGKEQTMYIEYETGKDTEQDFFSKCYNIASFMSTLNIIVPDGKIKKQLIERCQKLKQEALDKNVFPDRTIRVRLVSFMELQAALNGINLYSCENGIPWTFAITLNSPKTLKKNLRAEHSKKLITLNRQMPENDSMDDYETILDESTENVNMAEHHMTSDNAITAPSKSTENSNFEEHIFNAASRSRYRRSIVFACLEPEIIEDMQNEKMLDFGNFKYNLICLQSNDDIKRIDKTVKQYHPDLVVLSYDVLILRNVWDFGGIAIAYHAFTRDDLNAGADYGLPTIGLAVTGRDILTQLNYKPYAVAPSVSFSKVRLPYARSEKTGSCLARI